MAVGSNEPVVGASEVRKLEDKVRALERMLGRKTMENEILRGPKGPWPQWGRVSPKDMDQARAKKQTWHLPSPPRGGSP